MSKKDFDKRKKKRNVKEIHVQKKERKKERKSDRHLCSKWSLNPFSNSFQWSKRRLESEWVVEGGGWWKWCRARGQAGRQAVGEGFPPLEREMSKTTCLIICRVSFCLSNKQTKGEGTLFSLGHSNTRPLQSINNWFSTCEPIRLPEGKGVWRRKREGVARQEREYFLIGNSSLYSFVFLFEDEVTQNTSTQLLIIYYSM